MLNDRLISKDNITKYFVFFVVASFIMTISEVVFAAAPAPAPTSTSADQTFNAQLCRITNLMTGTIAKTMATLAIFATGGAFLLGKLNWVHAVTVAVGIIVIFNAPSLVTMISGDTTEACPPQTTR